MFFKKPPNIPKEPNIDITTAPYFNTHTLDTTQLFRDQEFTLLKEKNYPDVDCYEIDLKNNEQLNLTKLAPELEAILKKAAKDKVFITFSIPSPLQTKDKYGASIGHAVTATIDFKNKEVHLNDPFYGFEEGGKRFAFNKELADKIKHYFPADAGWNVVEDKISLEQKGDLICNYLAVKKAEFFNNDQPYSSREELIKNWADDYQYLNATIEQIIEESADERYSGPTGRFGSLSVPIIQRVIDKSMGAEFRYNRPLLGVMTAGFKEVLHHYSDLYPLIFNFNADNDFGLKLTPEGEHFVNQLISHFQGKKPSDMTKERVADAVKASLTPSPKLD